MCPDWISSSSASVSCIPMLLLVLWLVYYPPALPIELIVLVPTARHCGR